MIHFDPKEEPDEFHQLVREPGNSWLKANPDPGRRPVDYWNRVRPQLAEAFTNLCAYSAMLDLVGTVDHFRSCKNDRALAYEWGNYRYASAWLNSSKQTADEEVLDPFEVQDGWFEILLPSLQLVVAEEVPEAYREKAEFTLRRLHLRDDERVLRQRRAWYALYQEEQLSFEGLARVAPLIARAVEKQGRTA